MATEVGDVTSYKKLYMQFADTEGNKKNIILNDPKNLDDGDYADLAAQDAAIEAVMDTIISKNIFHNKGNDLTGKVNARIVEYQSTDVMDI
jgi:hypothetical protein